ncbi:hypothetical protein CSB62_03085 [Vibrio splendidus]|nr:hypothetical protein CSB62_03085 [Vibrio splendidus]PME66586.1 hypothetical protein BCV33_00530 [Vibrio lentus]PMG56928.1 hypothetical protein BCU87_22785 [Vibrio lentus]PMJ08127.1 hypothetical protein BCU31_21655 [Vibrio lentus]PML10831.1 hypothetical protein BCT85_12525 [Vibrio lentus]
MLCFMCYFLNVEARLEVSMFSWIKAWIKKYDKWCEDLGLTPENKRSCVAYRRDPQGQQTESREDDTANK